MLRTHTCGEINEKLIGKNITLCGWVHSRRDHGELMFLDLRDAYGLVQVVFDPKTNRDLHTKVHELKNEYVIGIKGKVRPRPEGTENTKIHSGKVEVLADEFTIFNSSLVPPFEIDDSTPVSEEVRLKYRYLDLRKPLMQKNLRLRHKVVRIIRNFLSDRNFVEIETPILTKSTPEGARDYLVPSRTNIGKFYALPQSPQLFKQILMVSGLDRYYQIARCFRDEDLRADRQPEFTQLDMEMSFVEEEDIFSVCEELMTTIFKEISGVTLKKPFFRLSYAQAMARFGTDKPDLRLKVPELVNVTGLFTGTAFKVFKNVIDKKNDIIGFNAEGCAYFSRKEVDELTKIAQDAGAQGLAYFRVEKDKVASPIAKFFKVEKLDKLKQNLSAKDGDLILLIADKKNIAHTALADLRMRVAELRGLIEKDGFKMLWVVDFPLFKYNEDEKRWESEHHPFTACREQDMPLLKEGKFENILARSYDLVINGTEIGSGSIRIHSRRLQEEIFEAIGIDAKEAKERFGFLIDAFNYGAPPHGGVAFGLDRFITLFTQSESIRDVIAFPKTQKGLCPMTGAPSAVDEGQLKELHIRKEK